ncbi:hypothetical protein PVAP13_5NG265102 [Panicum virgatum]|uniref:Uncharacterized protein n=1 Tax=Panicum virgatum TaxID=38727 RepID=A0A8T0S7F1_PANVG|nr:hypothetical protein PVAP13_5NG265102 [Panicum virgatum]
MVDLLPQKEYDLLDRRDIIRLFTVVAIRCPVHPTDELSSAFLRVRDLCIAGH